MARKNTLGKLKEQERELRRSLIVSAAREVFGEKTYSDVSMAEIARKAGMAKSSIYTYFNSQEALYAQIACEDVRTFIGQLAQKIEDAAPEDVIQYTIDEFIDYYTLNVSQWRMITHFALHGNSDAGAIEELNIIGRELMDLFDRVFEKAGSDQEMRLMSHALFSSLSGILIAFRNYPGRSEEERMAHMKRIGKMVSRMLGLYISKEA